VSPTKTVKNTYLVTALLVFLCAVGAAPESEAQDIFVVRGLGVGTWGSAMTPLFGVGVGVNLTSIVQVTFEASREFGRRDPTVAPKPRANAVPAPPGFAYFVFVDSKRVDRRLAVGARFRVPDRRLAPFAEVNLGRARLTTRYVPGSVPGSVPEEGSIETRPFVDVGGGLSLSLSDRTAVEASYRVGRVIANHNQDTLQAVAIGVAVGF